MKTQFECLSALLGRRWLRVLACAMIAGNGAWADNPWGASWREQIEKDFVIAERLAVAEPVSQSVTTPADAAGGCDGIINGEWGFHTGLGENPWWQVDLGEEQPIEQVRIWNRGAAPERAARVMILLSGDGTNFRQVYQHDGTVFHGFRGQPLEVKLDRARSRFVRIALPGTSYLHLDEVEVLGREGKNLSLHRPADQSSTSEWSNAEQPTREVDWGTAAEHALKIAERLANELPVGGTDQSNLVRLRAALETGQEPGQQLFLQARWVQRELALKQPLLNDFESLLFTKRVPSSYNHMSDQYYGWWSRPGGGICVLRGFTAGNPEEECLTDSFKEQGSFLRPTLSYDGKKVLFAWAKFYPGLAGETNKLDKSNVPEDAFYHLFEMNADGSGVRQITRGKYDDFDGRYLPNGRIVFLSTRRGQALQVGRESAARTLENPDQPDCYVRCGGGPERPVAVYTLHTIRAEGTDLVAISPFEMFEWTPEIANDGTILYSRWDYIDRDNMPYMGLWAINPDGSNARLVYKNYTPAPHCTFEAKPIPGSHKMVFTASAHHQQTMGSLVLLDPSASLEGSSAITRLTPEVKFPEIEGWPLTSYASPWPLSERFYLVAWGGEGASVPGPEGWSRWHAVQRPEDGMSLYLYDAATRSRELLWAGRGIACSDPIPLRPRERPPIVAGSVAATPAKEGAFLVADVYQGLPNTKRGDIKALRIVAVPAKTHPTMNYPELGLTADDPGKCVLGTVPVEPDGSAWFRAPAGVIVFFQALDEQGFTVQSMKSATHVQPGQTLSCIGCHEHRQQAAPASPPLAVARGPSSIAPGPDGSWPLRFDRLVQPVLDRHCVGCHSSQSTNALAQQFDLGPSNAYSTLVGYGKPSLREQVRGGYSRGTSIEGQGLARMSALVQLLDSPDGHKQVTLDRESRERLLTWIDTYAQRQGHFSEAQEQELIKFRAASSGR